MRLTLVAAKGLGEAHAQIYRVRGRRASGEDFDRLGAVEEVNRVNRRDQRHRCQCQDEGRDDPRLPEAIEKGNQKPTAQPQDEDVERVKEAPYHFESVKASIDSVFFAW